MKQQQLICIGMMLLLSTLIFGQVPPTNLPPTLSIQNEFIKIVVNNKSVDTGRFAIETTYGSPDTPADDFKPLIFGRPIPWTSYTTIQIDGENYVFGGINKKIRKRSGKKVQFGTVISQNITENGITTICQFNKIQVTQHLDFYRNPLSRVKDTAAVHYSILNEDTSPHQIGIRLMVDTKLGDNDGAPFRIGEQAVITEKKFIGSDIYDYWQTFDQLTSPNVIAQGLLTDEQNGINPPNRMYLVNWGTLVDNPWSFTYEEGRSFIRAGEFEKDTALALYWDPVTVNPMTGRDIKTVYGLGGVSMAPGELSLGLTAPAELYATSKKTFLIMGYVLNSGGYDSKNTTITFSLPKGFKLVDGTSSINIGLLKAGETSQVPIKARLIDPVIGKSKLTFSAKSDTLEHNSISRAIDIIGPPKLKAKLKISRQHTFSLNKFTDATLSITNPTNLTLENISVKLDMDNGLTLPVFEINKKKINFLGPRKTAELDFAIKYTTKLNHPLSLKAIIDTPVTNPQVFKASTKLTYKDPAFQLIASEQYLSNHGYFYIDCISIHPQQLQNTTLQINFDPDYIQFIQATPASWIRETNQEGAITYTENSIEIGPLEISDSSNYTYQTPILRLYAKTIQLGETAVSLKMNDIYQDKLTLEIKKGEKQ